MRIFEYRHFLLFFVLLLGLSLAGAGCGLLDKDEEEEDNYVKGTGWTIMVYGDGDNNLEPNLIYDIEEMKNGFVDNQGLNLIVLADRNPDYYNGTAGFGENFTDTRLYRISHNTAKRIGGGAQFPEITASSTTYEADMGDAAVLRNFIQFCKGDYPANKYALILWNHGSGVHKGLSQPVTGGINKGVCIDETDGGILYTAELTDVLTSAEYVDLLGFDVCLLGAVEVAYQYRPGTGNFYVNVMVASSPLMWGYGFKYDNILARLITGGGNNGETDTVGTGYESYYDPALMTALELGRVIVEEQYDSTTSETDQALACYDLSYVDSVKTAVDALTFSLYTNSEQVLFEGIRGFYTGGAEGLFYFDDTSLDSWVSTPMFDLYDLCGSIGATFNAETETCAGAVMTAVDNMVIYSFGCSGYSGFAGGQNGLSIFCPDGSHTVWDTTNSRNVPLWAYQWWYNALDTNLYYATGYLYGKLAWCSNGATQSNGSIDNWFELLDYWYDTPSERGGESWNGYDPF